MSMLLTLKLAVLTVLLQGLAVRFGFSAKGGDPILEVAGVIPYNYKGEVCGATQYGSHSVPMEHLNLAGCAALCSAVQQCIAFEFKPQHCRIKDYRTTSKSNCDVDVEQYEKPYYYRWKGKCFKNTPILLEASHSFQECKDICLLDPKCVAFDYNANSKCRTVGNADYGFKACNNNHDGTGADIFDKHAGEVSFAPRLHTYSESEQCIAGYNIVEFQLSSSDKVQLSSSDEAECLAICDSMHTCKAVEMHRINASSVMCVPQSVSKEGENACDMDGKLFRPAASTAAVHPWWDNY